MFAQAAITLIFVGLLIWIGHKLLYKPYVRNIRAREIDIERLEEKKRKLQKMKAEIQSTREEIDVTEEMNRIEKELKACEGELNRLEKKRGKRKKPQKDIS